jgi:hypothetical protein
MDRCSVAATLFRNTIDNGALFGMGTWCKDYGCPGIAVPVRLSGPEFTEHVSEVLNQILRAAVSSPYPKFPERPFEVVTCRKELL